ncbi:MAG: ATP synthase F0 subunit C [Acetivibrionales bacterium]|jgi:F-type H+-transporting ATPase subunit c
MGSEIIIVLIAGLVVLGAGLGAAIAIGRSTIKAIESTARQPEAADKILRILILGASLVEATAIYALVVSLLLIFTK